MGLRRVDLHAALWAQEAPLSRYQHADTVEWMIGAADLEDARAWLVDRGMDVKVEMYKVTSDKERYIRCILYAEMEPEDEIMFRLAFGL